MHICLFTSIRVNAFCVYLLSRNNKVTYRYLYIFMCLMGTKTKHLNILSGDKYKKEQITKSKSEYNVTDDNNVNWRRKKSCTWREIRLGTTKRNELLHSVEKTEKYWTENVLLPFSFFCFVSRSFLGKQSTQLCFCLCNVYLQKCGREKKNTTSSIREHKNRKCRQMSHISSG